MEEFEQKLSSRNPMFISRAVSQIVDVIKEKCKAELNAKQVHDLRELKFLREKCASSSSLISLTAAKGLIVLAQDLNLDVNVIISDLVSMLMNAHSFTGLSYAIFELILLEKTPKYNLIIRQHPLISILLHNSSSWTDILECFTCIEADEKFLKIHAPFFLYVFCDYNRKIPLEFKNKLWSFLLENFSHNYQFFDEILSWQKSDDKESLFQYNEFLIEYFNSLTTDDSQNPYFEVLVLLLASNSLELLKKNMNPSSNLGILSYILENSQLQENVNSLVFLVAEAILISPIVYLQKLLNYSYKLIKTNKVHPIILLSLKASCLHCILNSNQVSKELEEILKAIVSSAPSAVKITNVNSLYQISPNLKAQENIIIATEICNLCSSPDEDKLVSWLTTIKNTPEVVLRKIESFFFGLLMCNFKNENINLEVISIMNTCIECYPEMSSNFLSILLYKLANCKNSNVHISLLNTLPKLAVMKENIGRIVSTLQVLASNNSHPKLKTLALRLFFDLWKTQLLSYPLLANNLTQNISNFEFNTTKAFILMKLCETKPEAELAAYLSKILNKCSGVEGATASSLALLGLKHFSQQGLVDIESVWTTLEPNIAQENRAEVLVSLCDLLSEVATLPTTMNKHDEFIKEITGRLWKYATYHNDVKINTAAYKSLACFSLEQVSVNMADILDDSAIVPDSFGYIPGSCWLKLLHTINYKALDSLGDLLISLISKEIGGYNKGVYHTNENRREPTNLNYLQNQSIVRSLGNYLKENAGKLAILENKEVYLQVLRIFSQEYAKPLPPFDWCFLQELAHDTSTRHYCTKIASKQVILSGTARRFVENLIITITNAISTEDDVLMIYRNLTFLVNSIQPMLLEPFFENSVDYVTRNNSKILGDVLDITSVLLKDPQVQNVNKDVMFRIFAKQFKKLMLNDKLFEPILNVVIHAPEQYLEELLQMIPSSMSVDELKIAILIRSKILKMQKEPQFSLINDAVFKIAHVTSLHDFFLRQCAEIFTIHRENVASYDWFCEYLGQVQLSLAEGKYSNSVEMSYLCDLFTLSVIVISGCDIYGDVYERDTRLRLFPHALEVILRDKEWSKSTVHILEWLYYMVTQQNVPQLIKGSFMTSLVSLKHTEVFADAHKWTKYVSISIVN